MTVEEAIVKLSSLGFFVQQQNSTSPRLILKATLPQKQLS
jgi:hypothetical protein